MIFKSLELFNFGIYRGQHSIALAPKKGKPVILIGGLNGRGKTTLIDAFQLVLYGKFAKCSNRRKLAYDQFLKECINNQVSPLDGARLTLELEIRQNRALVQYVVTRTWNVTARRVNESVAVSVNGIHDPMLSGSWDQFIQQIMPLEISEFLFFDGEKIEQLAQPTENRELVKVGVKTLLGINLVSSLTDDLNYLPQRFSKKTLGNENKEAHSKIERLQTEIEQLENRRESQTKYIAKHQSILDLNGVQRKRTQKEFQDLGGSLFEQRNELARELENEQQSLKSLHQHQVKVAEGLAPLNLIEPLIQEILEDANRAKTARNNERMLDFTTARDKRIVGLLSKTEDKMVISRLKAAHQTLLPDLSTKCPEYLNDLDIDEILKFDLKATRAEAQEMVQTNARIKTASHTIEKLERELASLPREDKVKELNEKTIKLEKDSLRTTLKLELLGEERRKTQEQIETTTIKLNELAKEIAKANAETELERLMIGYLPTLVETLDKFKEESARASVHKLEHRILECFDMLIGKIDLIKKVVISPSDFSVTLEDAQGIQIPSSRLSAGERQLLAIAFIWGLSSSASTPLPTIIDTPLGRLDSIHRDIMINRYFPHAGAQVLLLSTDEEIDLEAYDKISRYVAREYSIIFDENCSSSIIQEGYSRTLEQKVA